MRTKIAALGFTAAILGSVLVPAFGGTAHAASVDACVGQTIQNEKAFHLAEGDGGRLTDAAAAHGFAGDMGGFMDFLRASCGK